VFSIVSVFFSTKFYCLLLCSYDFLVSICLNFNSLSIWCFSSFCKLNPWAIVLSGILSMFKLCLVWLKLIAVYNWIKPRAGRDSRLPLKTESGLYDFVKLPSIVVFIELFIFSVDVRPVWLVMSRILISLPNEPPTETVTCLNKFRIMSEKLWRVNSYNFVSPNIFKKSKQN